MNGLKKFWDSIRSNVYFVAFEGGASGALVNYLYDGLTAGKLDFSRAGLGKALAFAATGGITAIRLLQRPPSAPTVPAIVPPSTKIEDVPAKLEPIDPKAVKEQQ
jgi:hypothetical protein